MIFKMISFAYITAVLAVTFVTSNIAYAEAYRVNGSGPVARGIIIPNKSKIESDFGRTISVVANGSGNGLRDLAAGRSDIAMISADLQFEVELVRKKAPGEIDSINFNTRQISEKTLKFIVHPSNSVKSLTRLQIRAILSGEITNWAEFGGKSMPIMIVAEKPGNGTRGTVEINILDRASITNKARLFSFGKMNKVVAQTPGAFGYGNDTTIDVTVSVIDGVDVKQPLMMVTIGSPSVNQAKFISAVEAVVQ